MCSRSMLRALALLALARAPFATHLPTCSKMVNYRSAHATVSGLHLDYDEFQYPVNSASLISTARINDTNESSIIICYSGQTRGFNEGSGAAQNHINYFIKPLRDGMGFKNITVVFALNDKDLITNKTLAIFNRSTIVDKIAMGTIAADKSRRRLHPQYLGIEACGRLISKEEELRGKIFVFSVRIRYDLKFIDKLHSRQRRGDNSSQLYSFSELLPVWPIWKPNPKVDITLFQKHSKLRNDNIQRCLPQDVFFVARAGPVNAPNGISAAWPFQGSHTYRGYLTGDNRDHYEATLLGPAFDRRARIAVISSCGGSICWDLNRTKGAIFPKASTTSHSQTAMVHVKSSPKKSPPVKAQSAVPSKNSKIVDAQTAASSKKFELGKAGIKAPAKISEPSKAHTTGALAKNSRSKSQHEPHSSPTPGSRSGGAHRGLLRSIVDVSNGLYGLVRST